MLCRRGGKGGETNPDKEQQRSVTFSSDTTATSSRGAPVGRAGVE